ncbi:hypothetical protein C7959_10399 [Orenia marismortui]|uniref:Uncharacterized protein n=1 Tax=Orenia marismortui TaxID=46469 RepID=A0A4R8H166_9FIRM|nr:hypothetical protein C7959_10399 [Orenia marismortui]
MLSGCFFTLGGEEQGIRNLKIKNINQFREIKDLEVFDFFF